MIGWFRSADFPVCCIADFLIRRGSKIPPHGRPGASWMYHHGVRRQTEEAVKKLAKGSKLEIPHANNQQLPLSAIFDFRFSIYSHLRSGDGALARLCGRPMPDAVLESRAPERGVQAASTLANLAASEF